MRNNKKSKVVVIVEAAVSTAEASGRGIGLHKEIDSRGNTYLLWDVQATIDAMKTVKRPSLKFLYSTLVSSTMIGMFSVDPTVKGNWNASDIRSVAAEKGYGPLLYDIAMAYEKGLVPDRRKVSDAAKSVWQRYFDTRTDVEHRPLDDMNNPKTPPKIDDTERIYAGGDENPLNYAYFIKNMPQTKGLLQNNINGTRALAKMLNVDRERIIDQLVNATHDYFDKKRTDL